MSEHNAEEAWLRHLQDAMACCEPCMDTEIMTKLESPERCDSCPNWVITEKTRLDFIEAVSRLDKQECTKRHVTREDLAKVWDKYISSAEHPLYGFFGPNDVSNTFNRICKELGL